MAKKNRSSKPQPSPQTTPIPKKPSSKTLAPPPTKPASPSSYETESDSHPQIQQPTPPPSNSKSNPSRPARSKKQTPTAAAAAAAADSSNPYNRVFSDKDEIAILQGLADFKSKTGTDPSTNYPALLDSLKDSLSIKPTIKQVRQKVYYIKQKFEKKVNNDKSPILANPHDEKVYELCCKLWGHDNEASEVKEKPRKKENAAKKPLKLKEPMQIPEQVLSGTEVRLESGKGESSDELSHVSLNLSEMIRFDKMSSDVNVLKRGMELIDESERAEFERRWKKLRVDEMKLFVKRAELVEYQVGLILEAIQGLS